MALSPLTNTRMHFPSLHRNDLKHKIFLQMSPQKAVQAQAKQSLIYFKRNFRLTGTASMIAANIAAHMIALSYPKIMSKCIKLDSKIAKGEVHRLLTSNFLHGDHAEVAMNCYTLHSMGNMAESYFGYKRFVAVYIASGVLANSITYAFGTSPRSRGSTVCINGVMGALGMYAFRNKKVLGNQANHLMKNTACNVAQSLLPALFGVGRPAEQYDQIAGLVGGAIMEMFVNPTLATENLALRRKSFNDKYGQLR